MGASETGLGQGDIARHGPERVVVELRGGIHFRERPGTELDVDASFRGETGIARWQDRRSFWQGIGGEGQREC